VPLLPVLPRRLPLLALSVRLRPELAQRQAQRTLQLLPLARQRRQRPHPTPLMFPREPRALVHLEQARDLSHLAALLLLVLGPLRQQVSDLAVPQRRVVRLEPQLVAPRPQGQAEWLQWWALVRPRQALAER